MTIDLSKLRIEGIYEQRQRNIFMLRVKLPGGVLSIEQAAVIADIAEEFAGGSIHLTTRGSIEFHWLKMEDLEKVRAVLTAGGLTSRGACGGAVRGIVCSTPFTRQSPRLHVLARQLHQHFTNNPQFEGLPKKFKVGFFGGYGGGQHLMQDLGVVYPGSGEHQDAYDVWVAGGLGREPIPAFLLQAGVREHQLLSLAEGVIAVYRDHGTAGKRLKHLVKDIGRNGFVELLTRQGTPLRLPLPEGHCTDSPAMVRHSEAQGMEAAIYAGELTAAGLRSIAAIADKHAEGFVVLTSEQNIWFPLAQGADREKAAAALAQAGFTRGTRDEQVRFKICPGSHECKLGLSPTRDVARTVLAGMDQTATGLDWAIAGCPNSCSQPQLASVGIIATKIVQEEGGERQPRFDLYRRHSEHFGTRIGTELTVTELIAAVGKL